MKGTGGEGRGGDATMSRHTFPTPLLGGIPVTQPTSVKIPNGTRSANRMHGKSATGLTLSWSNNRLAREGRLRFRYASCQTLVQLDQTYLLQLLENVTYSSCIFLKHSEWFSHCCSALSNDVTTGGAETIRSKDASAPQKSLLTDEHRKTLCSSKFLTD